MRPSVPYGTSPFHVKGLVYARTKAYFDAHVPGGSAGLASSFRDPELRRFFEQQFLAMRWYDALPIEPLVEAEAAYTHQTVAAYLRKRAGWQAEEDIKSVYSLLLRIASTERVALAMPRLMAQIIDFGEVSVTHNEHHDVTMDLRGMPRSLAAWYEGGFTAYCERALLLAGAKRVTYEIVPHRSAGERAGVPLIDLGVRVRWI